MKYKIIIFSLLIMIVLLSGCSVSSNYKEVIGYQDFINDSKTGYDDVEYYNIVDSMESSKNARKYFIENNRRVGDYIITDYENGVCVNKFCGSADFNNEISIPETIDGKSVVKLGGYIESINDDSVIGAFGGNVGVTIIIPSSVKVISAVAFMNSSGIIPEEYRYMFVDISGFVVDEKNPYYSSKNGALYSKDYTKLLWVNTICKDNNSDWSGGEYVVPDFVETFEPSNGIYCLLDKITIGKSVKKINTYIDKGEDGIEPNPDVIPDVVICGYKGTAAEKWAKENYANFIALDN